MDMIWNIFFMFGGVAAMMLGMKIMGSSLEKVAGGSMKKMLGKVTSNRFAGVGVGVAVTSIIQSSTATTVMLVGFVNIGLMTLNQATNVIMGANIGTTVTAHIVSLSGMGAVDIGAIASMIGCVGIFIAMFVKNDKVRNLGNILAGLGMIFVGLEFISTYATKVMFVGGNKAEPYPFVISIFQQDHFPLLLILIGICITALVHSSSTITSLMVVLASIGVLPFGNAIYLALGSNIGTCITSIMSSAGTNVNAKRTAFVHLMFNVLGCVIFIVPIWVWNTQVSQFFASISKDVGSQIAIFHTLFNLITTAVLLPFSTIIVRVICKIIPDKKVVDEGLALKFIDNRLLETPPIAMDNTKKELVDMASTAKENLNIAIEMLIDSSVNKKETFVNNERRLNFLNAEITAFLTKIMGKEISKTDEIKIGTYYHVVSDLERIGDYAENITEYTETLREQNLDFSDEAKKELQDFIQSLNELFTISISAFNERQFSLLPQVEELEDKIDDYTVELENYHIDRLKKGLCTAQIGSVYLQTVSHLERIGDHITNVALSLRKYEDKSKSNA